MTRPSSTTSRTPPTGSPSVATHCAFQVKDRGYFWSIDVRTPSGALFEATVSKPEGMMVDEPYEEPLID